MPNFAWFFFFTIKSPSVTQRAVSQENVFKKEQKPVAFFPQNYKLNQFFYTNWKQFRVI